MAQFPVAAPVSWRASAYVKALVVCPNGERLSRTEKLVALVLADAHQDKGQGTFPAVRSLAEDALMDARVCRRMLAALERKGVILRLRAANQGRGQITFYRFPVLDGGHPAGKESAAGQASTGKESAVDGKSGGMQTDADASAKRVREGGGKGGQDVRLFFPQRRTEGGRKEDKTAPPSIEEQEQEPKPRTPCKSPAGGGRNKPERAPPRGDETPGEQELSRQVELVMQACHWTKPRLRRKIRAALAQACDLGQEAHPEALRMIDAWKYQAANASLLYPYGAADFIELGVWQNLRLLRWDKAALDRERMQAGARVGSR